MSGERRAGIGVSEAQPSADAAAPAAQVIKNEKAAYSDVLVDVHACSEQIRQPQTASSVSGHTRSSSDIYWCE